MRKNKQADDMFMDLAIRLAGKAEQRGEVPVGAIVVYEGNVVGSGYNSSIRANDATAHAEIVALRKASRMRANYRLTGCTLYSTLEPCLMCAGAMIHARIDRLVFACRDPKSGAAGSCYNIPADPNLNHRIEVTSGVGQRRARELLRSFFGRRRDVTLPQ